MHNSKKVLVAVLISFLLLNFISPKNSYAVTDEAEYLPENGCIPLDVVFIMGAPVSHIEWVLDALALQHLTRCTASDQVAQVGVVTTVPPEESNDSFVVMPLTPLSPSSIEIWNQQREALFTKLESATYIDDPRDIRAGFEAAFDLVRNNATSDSNRKTVFIYIGYPVTALGGDVASVQLERLRKDLELQAENLQEGSFKVWAILTDDHGSAVLNSSRDLNYLSQATIGEDGNTRKQGWDLITEQFDGKYFPTGRKYFAHNWQISNAVFEAISDASGLQAEVFNCGEYSISPYQGSMEIYFLADDDGIQIQVEHEDLNGNILQMTEGDVDDLGIIFPETEWQKNKVLLVSDPKPGKWRVNALGGKCDSIIGYRIYGYPEIEVFSPQEKLLQYDVGGEKFDVNNAHHLTIGLKDSVTGNPLILWSDYPPEISAELVRSDGVKESLGFAINGNNLLQSDPLNVVKDGLYEWNVNVSLPILNDRGNLDYQDVFIDIQGQYNVQEIQEVQFEIVVPQKGGIVQLHDNVIPGLLEVLPVQVQVALKDKAGASLDVQDVFVDPGKGIKVSLVDESTDEVIRSDVYLSVSEDDESLLVGEIGGGIKANSGEYAIFANLDGEINIEKYRVVELEKKQVLEREDQFFSWPPFWLGLAGLICLVIFLFIGYQVSLFINPLGGEIHFRRVDSDRPFFVMKLGGRRKMKLARKKLMRKSPILTSVNEISVSHASRGFGKGILLVVDLFDGSRKRKDLANGDVLLISKIIEAVYVDQEPVSMLPQDELSGQNPDGEDVSDE